ncbi:MAG: GNAT family N-acetyltransferase [Myxococcota bacterium]
MQAGYRLRSAKEEELALLPALEKRAGTRFEGQGLSAEVLASTTSADDLRTGWKRGLLCVAADAQDHPVGFALLTEEAWGAHLEEIDVDPEHGGRGVGTALLDAACQIAKHRGYDHLTLTTFSDIPWNAPFYASRGFRVLATGERTAALDAHMEEEAASGLDPGRRVAMRRRVGWRKDALAWFAGFWLLAMVGLSMMASRRARALIEAVGLLPGRDKTAHFLLMGGLAFVAVLALTGRRIGSVQFTPTGALTLVVGVVIVEETVQQWIPLRSFSLVDLAYSLAGVACFGALGIAWQAFRTRSRDFEPER